RDASPPAGAGAGPSPAGSRVRRPPQCTRRGGGVLASPPRSAAPAQRSAPAGALPVCPTVRHFLFGDRRAKSYAAFSLDTVAFNVLVWRELYTGGRVSRASDSIGGTSGGGGLPSGRRGRLTTTVYSPGGRPRPPRAGVRVYLPSASVVPPPPRPGVPPSG